MTTLEEQLKHVCLAKTQQDYDDALRLRYEHICKWNSYQKDKGGPVASIGDKFDPWTDYIIHRGDDGVVNGILRLIRPNDHGFFMGRYVDLSEHMRIDGRTIELCELVTHKDERGNAWIVGSILVRLGRYLMDRNVSSMAAISVKQMHPTMIKLGFNKIGDGFMTGWNKEMTLFVCDELARVLHNIILISPKSLRASIGDYLEIEL